MSSTRLLHGLPPALAACLALLASAAPAWAADARLGVNPILVAAARDAWGVIARPDNPIWPGWDASDTPLLFYLPGHQDLLINHPRPPDGFLPYTGPLAFPGSTVFVRDGPTIVSYDGQNTAMDVGGVRTLVVADPLSNLRQRVRAWIEDPRPPGERKEALELEALAFDPYDQLALVVHEAFHVYQHRVAPDRGANEMLLLFYPVLSVENNLGFALEASALQDALRARDDAAFRAAAVRWLAIRLDRRRGLPRRAIEYEDGTEFNEGLAKYTEHRLFQVLEGRRPAPDLAFAQGFAGYGDLSPQRDALIEQMVRNLRGEVNVNNDPYGAAPLRFRLYYSGMAIGLLLDRLSPAWKRQVMAADTSLTGLAREALHATDAELAAGLAAARADTAVARLRAAKEKLAEAGRARAAAKLAAIEHGHGTRLVVDYSGLESSRVGLAFSPFGVTSVDSTRTIFEQVPIAATFPDGSTLKQQVERPVLRDTRRREVSFRIDEPVGRSDVERQAGTAFGVKAAPRPATLQLPGVTLELKNARVAWEPGVVRVALLPSRADSAR